jgi:pimeloyl-ACP methyl ester carboxylesterase
VRRFALIVSLLALSAAPATAATGTVRMDDGVRLHYTLVEPPGQAPRGGGPGVVLMHGLGGSDAQMAPAARYFAQRGYAALAFSVRGEGASGGTFGLVGPRDVADLKAMVAWFVRRPAVSGRIGCFGISLGGGECWAGTAAGLFRAVVPVATWTDLGAALWPGGVARSGVLLALGGALPASSTLVQRFGAAGGALTPTLAAALRERSVASRLAQIRTPAFLVQGRLDYVFDVDQALTAFARLRGPRKLYVGDFGHPPSTFSSPDFPGYVLAQSARWFDRYLRGRRNGVERPAVAVADRSGRRRAPFAGLPAERVLHLPATSRAPAAVETFGDSVVHVHVTRLAGYPRLVAVVLANGRVVTHGAVVPRRGANTIRLADHVVPIPKGARLQVRLGRDGGAADPAYFSLTGGGTIRFDKVALDLSVLARPVTR